MSYFVLIVTNKLVFKSVVAKYWGLPRIVRSRPLLFIDYPILAFKRL